LIDLFCTKARQHRGVKKSSSLARAAEAVVAMRVTRTRKRTAMPSHILRRILEKHGGKIVS